MSLVEYASSSDDEVEEDQHEGEGQQGQGLNSEPPTSVPSLNRNQMGSLQCQQSEETIQSSMTSMARLPDASELLASLAAPVNQIGSDHSSRVAAAMAASSSRKRTESNGSVPLLPYKKLPRGNLPPSRIPPDTSGGLLLPPQLRGRSNVATEDIDKLFVRRTA